MATTRDLSVKMTPTFANTINAFLAGDDLNQQYIKADPRAVTTAIATAYQAGKDAIRLDGFDVVVSANHRPLGQRGAHKPYVNCRAQVLQPDGRVATVACKIQFSVENGMAGIEVANGVSAAADWTTNTDYVADIAAAALCAALNGMGVGLPTGTDATMSVRDAVKSLVVNGIIPTSA